MGYLAKTDQIDARVLLQMSEVINQHPEREKYIRPLPDAHRQILAAMVVRRRQLTAMLTAERNRLHPSHPLSHASIRSIISALKASWRVLKVKWRFTSRSISVNYPSF
jgi:transposase